MANFPSVIPPATPSAATLSTHNLDNGDGAGLDHAELHERNNVDLRAACQKLGITNSTDTASIDWIVNKINAGVPFNIQQGVPTYCDPVVPGNSASTNTTNMQALLNLGAFGRVKLKVPSGVYELNAIHSYGGGTGTAGHGTQIIGMDNTTSVLKYKGSGAGNTFITFEGPNDNNDDRLRNCGLEDICILNDGTADSIAVSIINNTHAHYVRPFFDGWKRNAIYASNFADTRFYELEAERCGSFDDSDKAVFDFNGTQTNWAVDQIGFVGGRIEECGDQVLKAVNGNGHYVGKLYFGNGFKVEASGNTMGGTVAQFHLENVTSVNFSDCDFTCQKMRTSHAVIPAFIDMKGTTRVMINNTKWALGADSVKNFTYLIDIESADSQLTMTNCIVESENAANWPTAVVRASNTPTAEFAVCGFGGGAKGSAPDWLTGEVQSAFPY